MTEKHADGTWSDSIYANGRRIVRADSYDQRLHISGTSTASGSYAGWYLPFSGYTIQSGDRLHWRQYQAAAKGGIGISFTQGGSTNWTAHDTDGDTINSDPTENSWHQRTVDLTAYAGKTINHFYIVADSGTPVGSWNIFYGDISIVHADGTVTTIYNRATSESFSYFTGGGETGTNAIVERSNQTGDSVTPAGTTTYFLADQIHSTRMTLAYGGWPMTQDTYYPFGVEPTPSASPDQYKFSGKERDPASGLDNFGARYYSAVIGRFMTPDWSASPEPVPYAKLDNPQSLNLYTYVLNNPLTGIDADGHKFCGSALGVLTTSYGQQVDATVSCAAYPPGGNVTEGQVAPAQQQVSQAGQDFIKGYEQLRLAPYDANPGHGDMTIGYGHKIKKGETFGTITKAEAESLFTSDVSTMASHVSGDLKVGVTQNQFDALVSLRFNAGPYAITPPVADLNSTGHATMEDFTNHYITAQGVFMQGLANRRAAEWNIFSKGIYDSTH